jgi:hypothetical protein
MMMIWGLLAWERVWEREGGRKKRAAEENLVAYERRERLRFTF